MANWSTKPLALAIAATACLAGCSLSGLDDFDIPECTVNADCAALNEAKGIREEACEAFQCRRDGVGCELRPRDMDDDGYLDRVCTGRADVMGNAGPDCDDGEPLAHPEGAESCDGIDNDCDGIIDEGVAPELEATATLNVVSGDVRVVFGDVTADDPWISVAAKSAGARLSRVRSDTPETAAQSLQFGYIAEQNEPDTKAYDVGSCPNPGGGTSTCSFAEVAATAFGERAGEESEGTNTGRSVVVAVNTMGCAHGQVRIGYSNGNEDVLLHGPAVHSNLFEGVDVDDDGCTGGSRDGAKRGARGVNVAGLAADEGREFPQALSGWLADSQSEHVTCGGSEVAVEVLGVWLESTSNREDVFWTNGTNDGRPEALGTTVGDGRPSVLAVDGKQGAGYFVAYGAAEGGIALHFVPAFASPPEYSFTATDARTTEPLGAAFSTVVAEGAQADHVALSVKAASLEADALELGVTWLDGDCAGERAVMFEKIAVVLDDVLVDESDPVTIAETLGDHAPSSAFVTTPLVSAAYANDHGESESGGVVVAWSADDGVTSMSRLWGTPLTPLGDSVEIADGAVGGPLLWGTSSTALAVYTDGGEVLSGPAVCGAVE